MPEYKPPEIIDTTRITIKSVSTNDYGDLVFIDQSDVERKISQKRISKLAPVFKVGNILNLNWAMYLGKKYIATAELVGEDKPAKTDVPIEVREKVTRALDRNGQETGMFWKELGECIRSGVIDALLDPADAIHVKIVYITQVLNITGIKTGGQTKVETEDVEFP